MEAKRTYIEHTADILFEAEAPTLNELFVQCGLALEESQIGIEKIEPLKETVITGKNRNIDLLLFDFLDDLLFHKDADQLIFSKFDINIVEKDGEHHLECKAYGEQLNPEKHEQKVDVKAITLHLFEVKEIEGGWYAKVLLDI